MSIAPINFTAKITRNWDGRQSETREQLTHSYDLEIQTIQKQKEKIIELDKFMHSSEIKPLLEKLPKRDIVDIQDNTFLNGYNSNEKEIFLEYMPMTEATNKKAFNGSSRIQTWHLGMYGQIWTEDGTLNKKGIKIWLNKLANFMSR